jgi:hypothetical protein
MSEDEIENEMDEAVEKFIIEAETERVKLLCNDLFETDLDEPDTGNEMKIELKQKEKPKIRYI